MKKAIQCSFSLYPDDIKIIETAKKLENLFSKSEFIRFLLRRYALDFIKMMESFEIACEKFNKINGDKK